MSMLQNRASPNIPQAPAEYDVAYMNALSNVIRLFFNSINTVQQLNLASLNLDLRTLPTAPKPETPVNSTGTLIRSI